MKSMILEFCFFLRWFLKNHVFIWLCQVLVATCGLLFGCAVVGSVVVACRLSCPETSGILVPQTRIEPMSPTLEGGFLTTGPPGKSCHSCFKWQYSLVEKHVNFGAKISWISCIYYLSLNFTSRVIVRIKSDVCWINELCIHVVSTAC